MATKSARKEKPRGAEAKMAESGAEGQILPAHGLVVAEVSKAVVLALEDRLGGLAAQMSTVVQAVADFNGRVERAEQRISTLEDGHDQASARIHKLEEQLTKQAEKLEDLENRSRRNNLRFIGIAESVREVDLRCYLEKWIPDHLPIAEGLGEIVLERAHRLGPYRESDNRPRAVIARFLNAAQKEGVLRAARQQRRGGSGANTLLIFQDYSAGVSMRRRAYKEVCSLLVERGLRFTLAYPARLRVDCDGGQRLFSSPEEAMAYCQQRG